MKLKKPTKQQRHFMADKLMDLFNYAFVVFVIDEIVDDFRLKLIVFGLMLYIFGATISLKLRR